jgi:hypothetical protein
MAVLIPVAAPVVVAVAVLVPEDRHQRLHSFQHIEYR